MSRLPGIDTESVSRHIRSGFRRYLKRLVLISGLRSQRTRSEDNDSHHGRRGPGRKVRPLGPHAQAASRDAVWAVCRTLI